MAQVMGSKPKQAAMVNYKGYAYDSANSFKAPAALSANYTACGSDNNIETQAAPSAIYNPYRPIRLKDFF